MYSIPAPVIKTILDHCDLPTAITFARVTKRCSNIFRHYREEILVRCEYINVTQMFHHCSDEFIIQMSKHEFFDKYEAFRCCRQMRYKLYEKMGYGKLFNSNIDKKMIREIFENNEQDNIIDGYGTNKLEAAKMGIDLGIPYPDSNHGLHAALILQDEKMINKLSNHGDFYVYCVTGKYHLADKYDIFGPVQCINDSNDPLSAFNYIEKRGYKFEERDYFWIEDYEILKLVMPRITKEIVDTRIGSINTKDYNALMIIYITLSKFMIIDEFFRIIAYSNYDFTKFLLQKYPHLSNYLRLRIRIDFIINLIDYYDNDEAMLHACKCDIYDLIRVLIKRNGQQWAQQFDHPFIKKYY